jgi:hypothetical protein
MEKVHNKEEIGQGKETNGTNVQTFNGGRKTHQGYGDGACMSIFLQEFCQRIGRIAWLSLMRQPSYNGLSR